MSVPREISLTKTSDGYRMLQTPVSVQTRRGKPTTKTNLTVAGTMPVKSTGESYELETEITLGTAQKAGIHLLKSSDEVSTLMYDVATSTLSFDRTKSATLVSATGFRVWNRW